MAVIELRAIVLALFSVYSTVFHLARITILLSQIKETVNIIFNFAFRSDCYHLS